MKTLFISLMIVFVIKIDDGTRRDTKTYIVPTLTDVADDYKIHTGMTLDTTKVFQGRQVYFQFRTQDLIFYCEKRRVVKGKLKRIKRSEYVRRAEQ